MRPNKSAMLIFYIFAASLSFQPDASAQRIDEASYHYPYKDPYLATSTLGLMQGSEKPPTSEIKDLRLNVLNHREDIRKNIYLEGMSALRYRFYQQNGPAPLIFIIPGLSGSAYSGPARFLAEWFADHGFHVLILPSPFNWNFALAASASGYPGYTQEDTQDLYLAMQMVLNDVKTHCQAQIGKIGMLGFSDGALYAAYVSKMDSEKKRIGIDTYLLVNPPVDLFEAARKIDSMAAIGKDFGADQKTHLEAYGFGVVTEGMNKDTGAPDYFADWNKRLRLKDKQIEFLIGKNLDDAVGDAIYVIDLANDSAILKTPISWDYRSGRLEEARSFGLMRYMEAFLVPRLKRTGNKQMNLKTLDTHNSIRGIGSGLKNNPAVFLMHNLDDILVSAQDIAYLEKVFGERAVIYPHGGHLGNLWYPDNKKHMLDVFRPLLQDPA
ncbi:MAG: alpha/beta hydrolase [Methylococcales bacterium]|nr:alpha/beta hydrolase [Methylococcales bacterium]